MDEKYNSLMEVVATLEEMAKNVWLPPSEQLQAMANYLREVHFELKENWEGITGEDNVIG